MGRHDEITQLLTALADGNQEALDALFPIVYDELRQLAHRQLMRERSDHTLNTTALVHEVYLKLVGLDRIRWQNRVHFYALAARAMRHILVNYAVRRNTLKRGGGKVKVPLDEVVLLAEARAEELLALDEALKRLEQVDERHSRLVTYRFFGGMTLEETAEALGVSLATVKRDWNMARAWLNRELSGR